MKRLTIAMLMVLCAVTALAGLIVDIQTGGVAIDTHVDIEGAVVTAVLYNGFFIGEIPNGPYAGIWVYDNAVNPVGVGDIVNVGGNYIEYFDLSEIDVRYDPAGYVTVVGFTDCYTPVCATIAELNAAIALDNDAFESVWVNVMDGMMVTELRDFGIWQVESYDTMGEYLLMDDYWYDDTTVQVGDCYMCASGIYIWNFYEWKLNPFVAGLSIVNCSVGNETMTFGAVKNLYR